jgi:hypothetical protein
MVLMRRPEKIGVQSHDGTWKLREYARKYPLGGGNVAVEPMPPAGRVAVGKNWLSADKCLVASIDGSHFSDKNSARRMPAA